VTARIVAEKRRARAVTERVRERLIAYNASKAYSPRYRRLVLSARDPRGRLVGGLVGLLYWNVLFVDLLWVSERARGSGIGRMLMDAAEKRARRAGKELVYLNTYTFQAPGFYRKLGFREFGRIKDYPRGASRIFLVKRLKN
jgi:GNAT superfamily N-acetyltransferase